MMGDGTIEEPDNDAALIGAGDPEIRELLGMFDTPAFARRGYDLESSLRRLDGRCRRLRLEMMEMVQLRLRQWESVAIGFDDWADVFETSIERLWADSQAKPPRWSDRRASRWRRRGTGRDLAASVTRFNQRWTRLIEEIDLSSLNQRIQDYNRYYILEKECVLGSHRLASRLFEPQRTLTREQILANHPLLLIPRLN